MSLYKRKGSPYWQYEFEYKGRLFRRSTGVADKREARTIELKAREDAILAVKVEQVIASPDISLRMEDAALRYFEAVKGRLAGARNAKRDLAWLVKHFGLDMLLTDINKPRYIDGKLRPVDDIKPLIEARKRDRVVPRNSKRKKEDCPFVSAGTVNHTLVRLQALFAHARDEWFVRFEHEPVWSKYKQYVAQKPVRVFEGNEEKRLEDSTRDDFVPVFAFSAVSAKRLAYCASLRWPQVHWARGVIERPGKRKPNGDEKPEITPITPEIRAILEPLIGHHPEYVFTYVAQRNRSGRKRGKRYPIPVSYLTTALKRACKDAKIMGFGFHSLRRSGATEFYDANNNDLLLTQKFLGHSDPKTTARYIRREDEHVRAGMEKRAKMKKTAEAHEVPTIGPHIAQPKVA